MKFYSRFTFHTPWTTVIRWSAAASRPNCVTSFIIKLSTINHKSNKSQPWKWVEVILLFPLEKRKKTKTCSLSVESQFSRTFRLSPTLSIWSRGQFFQRTFPWVCRRRRHSGSVDLLMFCFRLPSAVSEAGKTAFVIIITLTWTGKMRYWSWLITSSWRPAWLALTLAAISLTFVIHQSLLEFFFRSSRWGFY